MFVMHVKGLTINVVIWYDLILRFRPFFPKRVIFVDNGFYQRKLADWKIFEGVGVTLVAFPWWKIWFSVEKLKNLET